MEKVQLNLERFLPELRDLERKKVFTKNEIGDIVAKRRQHELACAKRDVKPTDYLRYIEYETRLEKLRKVRTGRLRTFEYICLCQQNISRLNEGVDFEGAETTTKKTLSDYSVAAHITQLHRLATRRFPSSITLWDAYLSHALQGSSPSLVSRALTDAIALHPTHVPYWLMASRWESDGDQKGMGGGNEEGARRLCMRALRFLRGTPGETSIWMEWIRVEVLFAERMRKRWELLGIGALTGDKSDVNTVNVDADDGGEQAGHVEGAIASPGVPEDDHLRETVAGVESTSKSGQEALRDGAVARVVIDNYLRSSSFSIQAYQELLASLRGLVSTLRLPLLSHVYSSLSEHHGPTSSSYPAQVRILATRRLCDFPPEVVQEQKKGEEFVDAVGFAVEEFWKVCKGRKGKGKAKAGLNSSNVWEEFCTWLEEMIADNEDEALVEFLTMNLTTALSLAPLSPTLALVHLRHLHKSGRSPTDITSFAKSITNTFSDPLTPDDVRENLWVARLNVVVDLTSSAEVFDEAVAALPFSARVWDMYATWVEDTLQAGDVNAWYVSSLTRVRRLDAVPPPSFASAVPPPRELIPQRFVDHLAETDPSSLPDYVSTLLATPMSLNFLRHLLSYTSLSPTTRRAIHSQIVAHVEAGASDWLVFAKDMLESGDTRGANDVVQRAVRALGPRDGASFEQAWMSVCDRL